MSDLSTTEQNTNRLAPLEGLRGVAAIIVVLFHTLVLFYPALLYGHSPGMVLVQHNHLEGFLFGNPLSVFFSGSFAVAIFFVLSGFVLSIGYLERGDVLIIKKLAAKRYLRLMLPALVSILIVWLILSLGLDASKKELTAATGSIGLNSIWYEAPNLGGAIVEGLRSIFTTGDVSYNPVLWTMKYEFIGSFLIFGLALFVSKMKRRWIIYTILVIGLLHTWYLAFVGGMLLADLYAHKYVPFRKINSGVIIVVLVFGLVLAGYPTPYATGTMYQTMTIGWLTEAQNQSLYQSIGAVILLAAILIIPRFSRFFSSKYIYPLGKYTFSLYLTHITVLFTVTAASFVWLHSFLGYNRAAFLSVLIGLPVIILVTIFFEKYIDQPAIRISGVFANWLLELAQREGVTAYTEHVGKTRFQGRLIAFREFSYKLSRIPKKTINKYKLNKVK